MENTDNACAVCIVQIYNSGKFSCSIDMQAAKHGCLHNRLETYTAAEHMMASLGDQYSQFLPPSQVSLSHTVALNKIIGLCLSCSSAGLAWPALKVCPSPNLLYITHSCVEYKRQCALAYVSMLVWCTVQSLLDGTVWPAGVVTKLCHETASARLLPIASPWVI